MNAPKTYPVSMEARLLGDPFAIMWRGQDITDLFECRQGEPAQLVLTIRDPEALYEIKFGEQS